MLKKQIIAVLSFIFFTNHGFSFSENLDDYIGNVTLQHYENNKLIEVQSNSVISVERIYIAKFGKTMRRYIFLNDQNSPNNAPITIFQDDEDNYYSYYYDTVFVMSPQSFLNKDWAITINEKTFVRLNKGENTLSGVFYEGEEREVSFSIEFNSDSVIVTKQKEGYFLRFIPIVKTSVYKFIN